MKIIGDLVIVVNSTQLISENLTFIQAPKAISIGSKIRIYFTSRIILETGYPESNIYFADFTQNFEKILSCSFEPILPVGVIGEFNEHGNAYFSLYLDENSNFGFFSGLSRKESTGIETAIGIAESNFSLDKFSKLGPGPLVSNSLNQPMLIGNPFLFNYNGMFYLYYIYGEKWVKNAESNGEHSRVYKIGLKTGNSIFDLRTTYNSIVDDLIGENECQATPCVFQQNGLFHMVFCYRSHVDFRSDSKAAYRLGYAFSTDLINWNRKDENLEINSNDHWDSEMKCYPSVFKHKDEIFLIYNGNRFGKDAFGVFKLRFSKI